MAPGVNHSTFNLAAHQRQRIRTLEQHVHGLQQVRDDLVRLLALTVRIAAGQDCNPYQLMFLIDAYDRQQQERRQAIAADLEAGERFLTLLRDSATEAAA